MVSNLQRLWQQQIVEGCAGDYREQLPARGTRYCAFVDPAGGSGPDAMTLAIAHKARPDNRIVIDAVREIRPPFSPTVVVGEFAELLKAYDVTKWLVTTTAASS